MTDLAAMATELVRARDVVLLAGEQHDADLLRVLDASLRSALEHLGVRVLDATGRAVDDRLHDVLGVRDTADPAGDALVCETVAPGYALGNRLLRPQQVIVTRLVEAAP